MPLLLLVLCSLECHLLLIICFALSRHILMFWKHCFFFCISVFHSHINGHQKCGFFKNGPHSGDFWKCQLLVYAWKDENKAFWIRWRHTSLLLALRMLFCSVPSVFICTGENKKEFKLHLYGKPQTSDSSWKFLKIENGQIKTAQNKSYGQKIAWN